MISRSNDNLKDDRSALEKIEHELYDPKAKQEDIRLHRVRDRKQTELPTSWGEDAPIITEAKDEQGASFGVKLLLVSVALLFLALGITGWRVFSLRNVVSSANIDLSADITPYVEGGAATPLVVTLFNRNVSPLEDASLTLMYKKGTGAQDEQEKVQERRIVGTINSNEYKYQDFNIVVYGAESESRDITLKLEYKVGNATFSKVLTVSTVLKTPPISVHVDGPDVISVGQYGTFDITVKNNSATTSLPSVLQLILPNAFTMTSADPRESTKGPTWAIAPLPGGESKKISITGSIAGRQGETTTMKALIGSQGENISTIGIVYASETVDVKLRASPLVTAVSLETDSGQADALRYGDRATLTITYANTGTTPLQDVSFKLLVSGDAAIMKQIDPGNGYYDSIKQTITWDKTSLSELASVPPQANGTFRVVIPIVTSGNNSPTLKVSLTGLGTDKETSDVVTTLSKSWGVKGSASINAKTTYKDSPFTNSGPIPPTPNTETTYNAHIVASAQNALTNTVVIFALPTYATWKKTTSDQNAISFDSKSRSVTWNIGTIEAGKSVAADIQIGITPSQSHVGQSPAITSGIVFDADEQVSGAHIRTSISPLTTAISGEVWGENPSRVVDR